MRGSLIRKSVAMDPARAALTAMPDTSGVARNSFREMVAAAFRPFDVEVDGVRLPQNWLDAIDSIAGSVERALSRIAGGGISIVRSRTAKRAAIDEGSLGLALGIFVNGERANIGVDLSAARAIVDAYGGGFTGLRGDGPLTENESGLLEFVVLQVIDECAVANEGHGTTVGIDALHSRADWSRIDKSSLSRIDFEIVVRGRRGRIEFWFASEAIDQEQVASFVFDSAVSTDSARLVELRYALPPIELCEEEVSQCVAGDLLRLGMRDLDRAAEPGAVTTATGWRLADARIVDVSATVMRARIGLPTLSREDARGYRNGRLLVRPHVGVARADRLDLGDWKEGTVVDFSIPHGMVAKLRFLDLEIGVAEIVRHDGELAMRLLSFHTDRLGER